MTRPREPGARSASWAGAARLTSLDGLRGLAALIVVVHHCALTLPGLANQQLAPDRSAPSWWLTYTPLHLLWAGGEAVLVFFVLSGLVLALPQLRTARSAWAPYYAKRLVRLYVPVIGAVVLTALVVLAVPREVDPSWSWWLNAHAVPVDATALLRDAWLLDGTGWLNSALWSLEYEVFFSLLLPLFVVVARGVQVPLWASVPVFLFGTGWAIANGHELISFMFVFAVGVMLAQQLATLATWAERLNRHEAATLWWVLVGGGGVMLLLSEWWLKELLTDATLWLPFGRPLGVLGAAVLVFCFLHCAGMRRFGDSRVLQWLGKISFSLYLVHVPVVIAVASFSRPTVLGLLVTLTVGIAFSVVLALGFHYAVEKPSQRLAGRLGELVRAAFPRTEAPNTVADVIDVRSDDELQRADDEWDEVPVDAPRVAGARAADEREDVPVPATALPATAVAAAVRPAGRPADELSVTGTITVQAADIAARAAVEPQPAAAAVADDTVKFTPLATQPAQRVDGEARPSWRLSNHVAPMRPRTSPDMPVSVPRTSAPNTASESGSSTPPAAALPPAAAPATAATPVVAPVPVRPADQTHALPRRATPAADRTQAATPVVRERSVAPAATPAAPEVPATGTPADQGRPLPTAASTSATSAATPVARRSPTPGRRPLAPQPTEAAPAEAAPAEAVAAEAAPAPAGRPRAPLSGAAAALAALPQPRSSRESTRRPARAVADESASPTPPTPPARSDSDRSPVDASPRDLSRPAPAPAPAALPTEDRPRPRTRRAPVETTDPARNPEPWVGSRAEARPERRLRRWSDVRADGVPAPVPVEAPSVEAPPAESASPWSERSGRARARVQAESAWAVDETPAVEPSSASESPASERRTRARSRALAAAAASAEAAAASSSGAAAPVDPTPSADPSPVAERRSRARSRALTEAEAPVEAVAPPVRSPFAESPVSERRTRARSRALAEAAASSSARGSSVEPAGPDLAAPSWNWASSDAVPSYSSYGFASPPAGPEPESPVRSWARDELAEPAPLDLEPWSPSHAPAPSFESRSRARARARAEEEAAAGSTHRSSRWSDGLDDAGSTELSAAAARSARRARHAANTSVGQPAVRATDGAGRHS